MDKNKSTSTDPNREVVGPGKFVEYSYRLYNDADGKLLFQTPKGAPDELVFGVTPNIVPGLLAVMEGLGKGDRFEITLPPAAAFGNKNDELIMTLDKEIFMRDGKLAQEVKKGATLPMLTEDNFTVNGTVTDITPDKIIMDFNHPFAGLTVRYEGEIEEVRDATPEDLPQGGCCGCGGSGCDTGSCNNGGCCGDGDGGCEKS
ncbi:MAG: FKBP-type peptidyl-prolyl cis-trans isomerase [Muribaculaceae bacterium]|nr:FKBP-type peptidyl-prolyl cis-trans isomerase [Muribaculaceae bacterium]